MNSHVEEIKVAMEALTGLSWSVAEEEERKVLRTTRPCRHENKVNFVREKVFETFLGWSDLSGHYRITDHNDSSFTLAIINVTPQEVQEVLKRHRRQEAMRQQQIQTVIADQEKWKKITGVSWTYDYDPQCLLSSIKFLIDRADFTTTLKSSIEQYCGIAFEKRNVGEEKKWAVKATDLTPHTADYYAYCRDNYERDRYYARQLADKISRVLGLTVDVADTEAFSDPLILFIQDDRPAVLNDCLQRIRDDQLVVGECSQVLSRLRFGLYQVSIPMLARAMTRRLEQEEAKQAQKLHQDYAQLVLQLQGILQLEHGQLRQQLLDAVQQSEQRLSDRINLSEKRIIEGLDHRLEQWGTEITQTLAAQGCQLSDIHQLVQRSQTYLMDAHEKQMQQYHAQQAWLDERLNRFSGDLSQSLSMGWQAQLERQLQRAFKEQEDALKQSMQTPSINKESLEKTLADFHQEWSTKQDSALKAYKEAIDQYLPQHGKLLEQTVQKISEIEGRFPDLTKDMMTCQKELSDQAIKYLCETFAGSSCQPLQAQALGDFFEELFVRKASESLRALETASSGDDNNLVNQFGEVAETLSDFFSIAIPGLRFIVKAAAFGTRKFMEYREQCFIDRMEDFVKGESIPELLTCVAKEFKRRYSAQVGQLNTSGMETLISRYLLPCLLAEMAKPHDVATLSSAQKRRLLLLSNQHNPSLLPIKVSTQDVRKHPWTAAGLVLGPMVNVNGQCYQRTDNPLRTLPWQPRPHRVYGERLGDEAELALNSYKLITDKTIFVPPATTTWNNHSLQVSELLSQPDSWDDQSSDQQSTCWHLLADQGKLVDTLKGMLAQISDEDKERLLAGLSCTDAEEKTILHRFFACDQENVRDLYDVLVQLPIKNTARWDQTYDQRKELALEIPYQAWQRAAKGSNSRVSVTLAWALSLLFIHSDRTELPSVLVQYPNLGSVLGSLPFDDTIISPVITAYSYQDQTVMTRLFSGNATIFKDNDLKGNSLLHLCIEKDDHDLLSMIGQVAEDDLSQALSHRNHDGDTPFMLAVKKNRPELLSQLCQHEKIKGSAQKSWGIDEAKALTQGDEKLLVPLNILCVVQSVPPSSFFQRQREKLRTAQHGLRK